MTNSQDNTEINLKQLSISNAYYIVSFHFLMNNMTLIRFRVEGNFCQVSLWRCQIFVSSFVMLLTQFVCFVVFHRDAVLVRVDSSSQSVFVQERDPESAVGLWLCIRAGWASCWCRIQDPGSVVLLRHSSFPQLELLPGYSSVADVSARLVHQAKLFFFFSPNTCVYI